MTRPRLVDNATWTKKASRDLRFEENVTATAPPRALTDDRAARIAELEQESPTRILWHQTDGAGADAPIHEWQACAITSKNCGQDWTHGSGFYLLHHDDATVPNLATHYRAPNDREDPRPSNGPRDPDVEARRLGAEIYARARSEGATQHEEIQRLRAALAASHETISTHLGTIAIRDQRIAALEADRVPVAAEGEHFLAPVIAQVSSFAEELRPYLGPVLRDLTPMFRAAAQEHLSAGAYSAGLLERLESTRGAYDRLLSGVWLCTELPSGFALKLPEPTDPEALAYHCPLEGCEAAPGEACTDIDGHQAETEPHDERRALARVLPREVRAALKRAKIEYAPISQLVPAPGATVIADPAVLAAARELSELLEMDAWQERQAQASPPATIGASSDPGEPEPAQAGPVAPPPPARPPAPIQDAEIVTESAAEDTPEAAERKAGLEKARANIRATIAKRAADIAELEAKRVAAKAAEEEDPE